MAKLSFASATILQKGPNVQLRIAANEYEGQTRLDVREFKLWGDKKEWKPTQNGVTVPLSLLDDFKIAVEKHGKELPRRVVDMDNRTVWVIAKEVSDAHFKKDEKHVYVTEQEALDQTPPDGYRIWKVKIEKGAVVREMKTHFRRDGEWKQTKPPEKPAAKNAAKKTVKVRR